MRPADVAVCTGTPPAKRKPVAPLVEPTGRLATLAPIASPMKPITARFSATADGVKWLPCTWTVAGLLGSADPERNSGSSPGPKMNRLLI